MSAMVFSIEVGRIVVISSAFRSLPRARANPVAGAADWFATGCAACSTNRNRCTFPEGPFGKSSAKLIRVGVLKWPSLLSQNPSSSRSSHATPARNTTKAMMSSPK